MKYIVYLSNERYGRTAENREALIKLLAEIRELVDDIRKTYKNGITDSVLEKYQKYLCMSER